MIQLPDTNIRLLAPVDTLDYFDSQSVHVPFPIQPLQAWTLLKGRQQPLLKAAFWLRDAIASCFGVKKIGGFSKTVQATVKVGDYLDFFLVEYTDETALVLTERDKHLDVMTCISTDGTSLTITSSVLVHNWFGHAYMVPVGIAHRWFVSGMLKRLPQELPAQP